MPARAFTRHHARASTFGALARCGRSSRCEASASVRVSLGYKWFVFRGRFDPRPRERRLRFEFFHETRHARSVVVGELVVRLLEPSQTRRREGHAPDRGAAAPMPPKPCLANLSLVGDSVYNCLGSMAKIFPIPVLSLSMNPVVLSTLGDPRERRRRPLAPRPRVTARRPRPSSLRARASSPSSSKLSPSRPSLTRPFSRSRLARGDVARPSLFHSRASPRRRRLRRRSRTSSPSSSSSSSSSSSAGLPSGCRVDDDGSSRVIATRVARAVPRGTRDES